MRYAHTNLDSKRAAVEKLDGFGDNLVRVPKRVHQNRAKLSLLPQGTMYKRLKNGGVAEWLKAAVLKSKSSSWFKKDELLAYRGRESR